MCSSVRLRQTDELYIVTGRPFHFRPPETRNETPAFLFLDQFSQLVAGRTFRPCSFPCPPNPLTPFSLYPLSRRPPETPCPLSLKYAGGAAPYRWEGVGGLRDRKKTRGFVCDHSPRPSGRRPVLPATNCSNAWSANGKTFRGIESGSVLDAGQFAPTAFGFLALAGSLNFYPRPPAPTGHSPNRLMPFLSERARPEIAGATL